MGLVGRRLGVYNLSTMNKSPGHPVSVAIETSSREGGVGLGCADRLVQTVTFDASRRHATQVVTRLDEMLRERQLQPNQIDEVYVSVGGGSFTGVRVGVTVARTLGQAIPDLRCVGVPTPQVVAENARDLGWENLAVVLDAREGCVHAQLFTRREGEIVPDGEGQILTGEEFLDRAPRPLLLTGEGLNYHEMEGEGVELVEPSLRVPTAEGVWRVGRKMARRGEFTDFEHLLPVYVRSPKPRGMWDAKGKG